MSGGLAWLNDLMVWMARWVPRLTMIKVGYVGVLFGRKGSVRGLNPGLCCYWPITHELTVVSIRSRTFEIAAQLHGAEVISLVVMFCLTDPVRMLLETHDVFSLLDDRAQAHLSAAYRVGCTSEHICEEVHSRLAMEMEPYGVRIDSVDVAQRGSVLSIKLLNDYAQHSHPQLGDEKVFTQATE